jgi:hypothetical protein
LSWKFLTSSSFTGESPTALGAPGSRAASVAMAFTLIESAQARWQAVNAPHLVAPIRAGAVFKNGKLVDDPADQRVVISKSRDTPFHRS